MVNILLVLCTCTLEWVGLVPPTAAPFSFEMDVVLIGVALFFVVMHFLAPSDFHVRLMCVCVSVYLSVCLWGGCIVFVCVCASANGESELR